ncbi:MAG: acyl-phosphate glycerol 3-phosphate acyltransferase [Gemmatimonadetes bacterium]|nr:MAG: acyl-phosphate glycerol 3-phosphate acyltransferase [Gemmatimonadota bacterium]
MGVHRGAAHDQVPAQAGPALNAILAMLASYLLGATPTSYIAGRVGRGIDLRAHGSKNLGATNVYRILGWKYAIPVALFDIAKGAIPVLFFSQWAGAAQHPWLPVVLGGAAVLGHMFSPYVSFKGGKGVATAAGMFLALAPVAVLLAILVWVLSLWLTGYVSLSSIVAVLTVPVSISLLQPGSPYTFWASVALVALIIFAHRRNISRLVAGTENRFRTRPTDQ